MSSPLAATGIATKEPSGRERALHVKPYCWISSVGRLDPLHPDVISCDRDIDLDLHLDTE